jgi:hypothetical protein
MPVETMVMTEVLVMMPVMMMVSTHPGIGVEHARLNIHGPHPCAMRGPARAVGHRGCRNEHRNRKQGGGDCLQHGRVPPAIARMSVGWPGSSIMALNLMAAR